MYIFIWHQHKVNGTAQVYTDFQGKQLTVLSLQRDRLWATLLIMTSCTNMVIKTFDPIHGL